MFRGHAELVRFVLRVPGVDVNAQDKTGFSALHWACLHGRDDIVALLVQVDGIDTRTPDSEGLPPLHGAVVAGHAGVVRVLLASGKIDAAQRDEDGDRALDLARRYSRDESVLRLLEQSG